MTASLEGEIIYLKDDRSPPKSVRTEILLLAFQLTDVLLSGRLVLQVSVL